MREEEHFVKHICWLLGLADCCPKRMRCKNWTNHKSWAMPMHASLRRPLW